MAKRLPRVPYAFVKQLLITEAFTEEHFAQLGWAIFGRPIESHSSVLVSEGVMLAIGKWLYTQQQLPMSKVFRILEKFHGRCHQAIDDPESIVGHESMALIVAIADASWISWCLVPGSGKFQESFKLSDLQPHLPEGESVFSSVLDVLSLKRWFMKQYELYQLANPSENTNAAAPRDEVSTAKGTS